MIRRVIILALVVPSLLLAIASAALWARSYWMMDSVYLERIGAGWQLTSVQGRLIVVNMPAQWNTREIHRGAYAIEAGRGVSSSERLAEDNGTSTLGPLYWGSDGESDEMTAALKTMLARRGIASDRDWAWLGVPHAAVLLPFGIVATALLIPLLRRGRRVARGLCPACGYDLRASADRCPECGAVIPALPPG